MNLVRKSRVEASNYNCFFHRVLVKVPQELNCCAESEDTAEKLTKSFIR